jgi:Xaa-Pro dipeptidase
LPHSVDQAHVDTTRLVTWYDGQHSAVGPRRLVTADFVSREPGLAQANGGFRVHDRPGDPYAQTVSRTIDALRRQKDPDELALLRRCMRATDVGHAWARANIAPGMTELDVYLGVAAACQKDAGQAAIVYGDFAVSPGPERRGGPPTDRVLAAGDLFILDYSVVLEGYRSDFTNTLAVGKRPTAGQQRLFDVCRAAMSAGEAALKAGAACKAVFDAVEGPFQKAGETLVHHAGHGLGLGHPEDPFLVRHANETLLAGDVVTLEPGLYLPGVGGLRIENNYLITDGGYEKLSNHVIALV